MHADFNIIKKTRQERWVDRSPQVGYAKNQLKDEEYHIALAINNPLWRFVVLHYQKELYGKNINTVNVLGYNSIPFAIELSQWFYDVTFMVKTKAQYDKAKKDCEIHAGVFKNMHIWDYLKDVPRATVTMFIGVVDVFSDDQRIYDYFDLLLRRSEEVVCALRDNRDWNEFFRGKYQYKIMEYPDYPLVLVNLKELEA